MPAAETEGAFVGIRNEQEFYSDHYLAEIFDQDLKRTTGQWRQEAEAREEPGRTPDAALRGLKDEYFQFRAEFGAEQDARKRVEAQRGWLRKLPGDGVLDWRRCVPSRLATRATCSHREAMRFWIRLRTAAGAMT